MLSPKNTQKNENFDLPALINNNAITLTSIISIATVTECCEHFNASKVKVLISFEMKEKEQ